GLLGVDTFHPVHETGLQLSGVAKEVECSALDGAENKRILTLVNSSVGHNGGWVQLLSDRLMLQQWLNLPPNFPQFGTNLVQECCPSLLRELDPRKMFLQLEPQISHSCVLIPSSRANQTFANSISRRTVDAPISIVLAISSTVMPPKNQNSTTL